MIELLTGTIRSATDYGLRFTVSGITQLIPVAAVDLSIWGFPSQTVHDAARFPKGSPGKPAGCPGLEDAGCNTTPVVSSLPLRPLTGNPSICTGESLPTTIEVRTYRDPANTSKASSSYPPITDCDRPIYSPVSHAMRTPA